MGTRAGGHDFSRRAFGVSVRKGVAVEAQKVIRVLLVDDIGEIRTLLRELLDLEPDLEVVGEADDGVKALKLVADFLPDAIVMDMEMPRMGGVEATREIKRRWPAIEVIAFTASGKRLDQHAMLEAGAHVKLDKQDVRDVPQAIRRAVQVRRALDSPGP